MHTRVTRSGEHQTRARRFTHIAAATIAGVLLTMSSATAALTPAVTSVTPKATITATGGALGGNLSSGSRIATATTLNPTGNNAVLNMFQWNWNSVAAECTTSIGPAGFAYVQVSPPQEHIVGEQWWTSYQPVSYTLESKLGTRAEFKNMVDTCRDAGVGIIADAVINHMTGQTESGIGFAGTEYSEENYPNEAGKYGPENFHDCRTDISDYNDRYDVQNCRLVKLQDLDTSQDYVQQEIATYLDDLAGLGVAGFRIDAAKHMAATDVAGIKAKTTSARDLYWIFEVIGSASEPIQPEEYVGSGDSHEFNYARTLRSAFNGRISGLQKLAANQDLLDGYKAGVFVDNHDTERNGETLSYHDGNAYLLANVFLFSYPYASPTAYTGYTFNKTTQRDNGAPQDSAGNVLDVDCAEGAFTCIHRTAEIANMVGFYNDVRTTELNNWDNAADGSGNVVGYGRGDKGFVVLNNSDTAVTHSFATRLPQGTYCNIVAATDLTGCAQEFTVAANGSVDITVPAGESVVLWTHHATTTGPSAPAANAVTTVYFHKYASWDTVNLHHEQANGNWTTAPGTAMTPTCDNWYSLEVTANGPFKGVFNNGTQWNNPLYGGDYTLSGDTVTVSHGVAIDLDPCGADSYKNTVVYYRDNPEWDTHNIHYQAGISGWTAVPGERLSPACEGWVRRTIETRGDELTFVFNDGGTVWDNADNASGNYSAAAPIVAVDNKVLSYVNPCEGQEEQPELPDEEEPAETINFDSITVYYPQNAQWNVHNIHFGIGSNWTDVPGREMAETCEGWLTYTVEGVQGATQVQAVFNNGDGDWDSNGGANYTLTEPTQTITDGQIGVTNPCADDGAGDTDPGGGDSGDGDGDGDGDSTGGDTDGNSGGGNGSDGTDGTTPDGTETGGTDGDGSSAGENPTQVTPAPQNPDTTGTGTTTTEQDTPLTSPTANEDTLADTGARIVAGVLYLSVLLLVAGTAAIAIARHRKHNAH